MTDLHAILTPALIEYLKSTYRLSWNGLHGWAHWVRVYENGMRMAARNGANQEVVALFAFTHDMARHSDGIDPLHGPRAAHRIVKELQGRFFNLGEPELALLVQAVKLHTAGQTRAEVTVQTCWDSDRLDLGRAGIRPDPKRLCTPEARDLLEWAYKRSIA